MLFVADIGNTHTCLGVFEGETLRTHWRVASDKARTADEFAVLLKDLCDLSSLAFASFQAAAVSCVVPPLLQVFEEFCSRYLGLEPLVVGPGVRTGMPILTDNPREVGADRIVNAVAAYHRVRGACVVVDFGTATTFDCISSRGDYLGGAIVPGISISLEALVQMASKLPRVEISRPRTVIGKNTVHSMQSGILFGYVSLVDGMVERIRHEMGEDVYVIATGGLAGRVAPESRTIQEVDELLTLKGLQILHRLNQKDA